MNGDVDRKAVKVILAVLGIEQRELAAQMGYEPSYVANVLIGCTEPSGPFRRALGETIATLVLGPVETHPIERYPAEPLLKLIERRAAIAPSKREFYADLGFNGSSIKQRRFFSSALVDRVCCALGVHPGDVYPEYHDWEEAS